MKTAKTKFDVFFSRAQKTRTEEIKKGIDKLHRRMFVDDNNHEYIDTCDIYKFLQTKKNEPN